jgi:hypothetical protein
LRYLPIDGEVVRQVRETLRDGEGNALHVRVSEDDGSPCRACLRLTPRGTRLILFAHRPSQAGGPYAETGPVFVHADPCEAYREAQTFPVDFRPRTLVFRAYDAAGEIADATLARGEDAERVLGTLFALGDVARVDVRNPAWGCYDFSVVRA